MGLSGAPHGCCWNATLPKIVNTYPTMIKLCTVISYRKKIQKNIQISWHTPWVLLILAFFHWKSVTFVISRNTDIDSILMHNLYFFNFWGFLKVFLINLVVILIMSVKLTTLGLLKINIFWNRGYNIIHFAHDVTHKILSRKSNHIVAVVMWRKFDNSSISIREVIITPIL